MIIAGKVMSEAYQDLKQSRYVKNGDCVYRNRPALYHAKKRLSRHIWLEPPRCVLNTSLFRKLCGSISWFSTSVVFFPQGTVLPPHRHYDRLVTLTIWPSQWRNEGAGEVSLDCMKSHVELTFLLDHHFPFIHVAIMVISLPRISI